MRAAYLLLCLLIARPAFGESPFRSPVEFLEKSLVDIRFGPGYIAKENFRVLNTRDSQSTGAKHGPDLLYDLRFGPVNISNVFTQAGFTRGTGLRLGLLFTYTGDSYKADGMADRGKTLFGGGFIGYSALTFYAYSDLLDKHAGTIYAVRFAPALIKTKKNEITLVFEAEHMNRLYVDYYFGVRKFEATAKLPYFEGQRTTNFSATLLYIHTISSRFEFSLWGGEKRYGSGVTRSPTVGLKHQYQAGAGILFYLM